MLITLHHNADSDQVQAQLQRLGLWTRRLTSNKDQAASFLVQAHSAQIATAEIASLEGVADVCTEASHHPRIDQQAGQGIAITPHVTIGGDHPAVLMAGPCSVESQEQIHKAAASAAHCGAKLLRGGAFKPRSSPYSFEGHGRKALSWLREAADAHGLGVVTEIMSEVEVDAVASVADLLQVGSRSMQSYALLKAIGKAGKPVLLKRGMAATVDEWLLAGEHLMKAGASGVLFCERGIQSFDRHTRNLLDIGAVALLRHVFQQPVVVDPSHAAGRRDLVIPLAQAALAVGAHGLLVEAHPHPETALSDGPQAIGESELALIGREVTS